jgi:hypothetical protein
MDRFQTKGIVIIDVASKQSNILYFTDYFSYHFSYISSRVRNTLLVVDENHSLFLLYIYILSRI